MARRDFSQAAPAVPAESRAIRGAWIDVDEAVSRACADKNVLMALVDTDRWASAVRYTLTRANDGSAEVLAVRDRTVTDDKEPQSIFFEVRVGGALLRNPQAEQTLLDALGDAFDEIARTAAKAHRR